MKNVLWLTLLCMLLLSGCGWNGTPTRVNDFTPLTSIEISAVTSTIAAGTSTTLKATGNFSGQFTRDITTQVSWASGSTVASFPFPAYPNRVKADTAAAGTTAALTASMNGVMSTPFTLNVSSATIKSVVVTSTSSSVAQGLDVQCKAEGTFTDGTNETTQDVTYDVVWSSSDPAIATVSAAGLAHGVTKSDTAVTITAKFGDTPLGTGTLSLKVDPPTLQSIAVTPTNSSIAGLSKTVTFTATGSYSNGTTADVTTQVVWESSLPSVATIIAGSGVATTVAQGTTSISATMSGVIGKTNLTVTTAALINNGLKLSSGNLSQNAGSTNQLKVTATFTDNSTQDVTASCDWTSSNTLIATVGNNASDKGLVTGVVAGVVTIHTVYGGQTLVTNITVQ